MTNWCNSDTAPRLTLPVIIPANPGTITGANTSVCVSATISLFDTTAGMAGTWGVLNGGVSVNASGVVTGLTTAVPNSTDTVIYSVLNSCGVTTTAMYPVYIYPLLNPGTITGDSVVCQNTTQTLSESVSGGIWSSLYHITKIDSVGTFDVIDTAKTAGTDTILYTLTNVCGVFSDTFMIRVKPAPYAGKIIDSPAFNIYNDTGICIGGQMWVKDTTLGGHWLITNGNATLNDTTGAVHGFSPGNDTIIYYFSNSCGTDTTKNAFHVFPLPNMSTIQNLIGLSKASPPGLTLICNNITDTITSYYTGLSWSSTNSSVLAVDSVGVTSNTAYLTAISPGLDTVVVSLTQHQNCINTLRYPFHVLDTPAFSISSNSKNIRCFGLDSGSIQLTITLGSAYTGVASNFNYEWTNGYNALNTTSLTNGQVNLPAGGYGLTIIENYSHCRKTDTFVITQPEILALNATVKNDTCKTGNGSVWLAVTGGVKPYAYAWSNNGIDTFIGALHAGNYSVILTDNNSCTLDSTFDVQEGVCDDIIVYDVITPNGDGINDYWVIKGIQDYPENEVMLFDKWGDMVYSAQHYHNEWDGKGTNGTQLPDGTYFYIVKLNAVNESGASNVKTGSLLIKH